MSEITTLEVTYKGKLYNANNILRYRVLIRNLESRKVIADIDPYTELEHIVLDLYELVDNYYTNAIINRK